MICTNALLDILEVLRLRRWHTIYGGMVLGSTVLQGKASPSLVSSVSYGQSWGDPEKVDSLVWLMVRFVW